MAKTSRIFNIMQYERHPDTGELITMCDADGKVLCDADGLPLDFGLNLGKIERALRFKSICRWAYILHDKDRYTLEDEEANPAHEEHAFKPAHWHVVIESNASLELQQVAKWFGIPMQFIDVPKGGRRAFLDCVQYLTHEGAKEQLQGKELYEDEEVVANFDFRTALNERAEKMVDGKELKQRDFLRSMVMEGKWTLRDVMDKYPLDYLNDINGLKAARSTYLAEYAPLPSSRVNYYITGAGGDGKSLASRGVARSLFPNLERDEEIFFVVGAENVSFEGYDGQPVIIWDDFRAYELLRACGGRGNFFNLFDTHPPRGAGGRQNIKHGSVRLVNCVNIVNSVQPWREFLDALVGEYVDKNGKKQKSEKAEKSQSYRRFPIIIPVSCDDFEILINKGVMNGTREFLDYHEFQSVRGNFRKIAQRCQDNEQLARTLEGRVLAPVPVAHQLVLDAAKSNEDEAAILAEFADYVKPVAVVEFEKKVQKLLDITAAAVGGDPDGFIEKSGIMNISDPAMRCAILSLVRNAATDPDGNPISQDVLDTAQKEFIDASAEERADVLRTVGLHFKEQSNALQWQICEGIVCPDTCKTDKERVDYVLPRLRAALQTADEATAASIRAAIERLEACRFDEDGEEVPF